MQVANWHVHVHVGACAYVISVLVCRPFEHEHVLLSRCRQYKEQPETYKRTARHWAQVYAGGEGGGGGRERGGGGRAREVGEGKGEGVREVGIQCNMCPNLPSPQVW